MSKNKWPKNRPVKPIRDPMLDDLVSMLEADPRSNYAKAAVSGLSPATLRAWQQGKVSRPQGVSIQMAYKMLGFVLKPVLVGDVVRLSDYRKKADGNI